MLDPHSQTLVESANIPESISGDEARDTLSTAYLDWLARYAIPNPELTGESDFPERLSRLSLASSILDTDPDHEELSQFLIAEAADIARIFKQEVNELPAYSLYRRFVHYLDIGSYYHLADYDANARIIAKKALALVDARSLIENAVVSPAQLSYYRALAQFLLGRLQDCREEAQLEVEANDSEDRAFVFARSYLAELSRVYRGENAPSVESRQQLSALQEVLRDSNNPYFLLKTETTRLIDFTQASSRKALYPFLERILPNERDYLANRISSDNNSGYSFAWPPVQDFCNNYFTEEHPHAVITVPTGAGKSFLAELAIAQALQSGWVLYLAPTNALCSQIKKELNNNLQALHGANIEEFIGGVEYTLERPTEQAQNRILIATPEKALLLSKLDLEIFNNCSLIVLDECHILGEHQRGEIAETVLALAIAQNPAIRLIMMSALVSNGDMLAEWLRSRTGRPVTEIKQDWRPTRSARLTVLPNWQTREYIENTQRFSVKLKVYADTVTPWSEQTPLQSWLTSTELESRANGSLPWINQASYKLAEELIKNKLQVLLFVLKSKHHAFSIANDINPELHDRLDQEQYEDNLFRLAEYELGGTTILESLVEEKGIAIHTAAMLDCEREASEIAFNNGRAKALIATGTLSQGLNLPADIAIIAGTQFAPQDEHEDDLDQEEESERKALKQVLNAVGRSARANIAIRGASIIIPDNVIFQDNPSKENIMGFLGILRMKDASLPIESPISSHLQEVQVDTPEAEPNRTELHLLSRFPFEPDKFRLSLQSSIAGTEFSQDEMNRIIERLGIIKDRAIEQGIPTWIMEASSVSGFTYTLAENLRGYIRDITDIPDLVPSEDTYIGWIRFLIRWLRSLAPIETWTLLRDQIKAWRYYWGPQETIDPNIIEILVQAGYPTNVNRSLLDITAEIWANMEITFSSWLNDASYIQVSEILTRRTANPNNRSSRTSAGHFVPRTIIWSQRVAQLISRFAGLLLAIEERWLENEPNTLPEWLSSSEVLPTLPLGIRYGVRDPESLAIYRFVLQERRAANFIRTLVDIDLENKADRRASIQYAMDVRARFIQRVADDPQNPIVAVLKQILNERQ